MAKFCRLNRPSDKWHFSSRFVLNKLMLSQDCKWCLTFSFGKCVCHCYSTRGDEVRINYRNEEKLVSQTVFKKKRFCKLVHLMGNFFFGACVYVLWIGFGFSCPSISMTTANRHDFSSPKVKHVSQNLFRTNFCTNFYLTRRHSITFMCMTENVSVRFKGNK